MFPEAAGAFLRAPGGGPPGPATSSGLGRGDHQLFQRQRAAWGCRAESPPTLGPDRDSILDRRRGESRGSGPPARPGLDLGPTLVGPQSPSARTLLPTPTMMTGRIPPPHLGRLMALRLQREPAPDGAPRDFHPRRAVLLGRTPQLSPLGSGLTRGPRRSAPADRDSGPQPKAQRARERNPWAFAVRAPLPCSRAGGAFSARRKPGLWSRTFPRQGPRARPTSLTSTHICGSQGIVASLLNRRLQSNVGVGTAFRLSRDDDIHR